MTAGPAPIDLEALLRDEGSKVERALERACDWLSDELPEELFQPARHAVLSGGKRLRPILCVIAYRACGGSGGGSAGEGTGRAAATRRTRNLLRMLTSMMREIMAFPRVSRASGTCRWPPGSGSPSRA